MTIVSGFKLMLGFSFSSFFFQNKILIHLEISLKNINKYRDHTLQSLAHQLHKLQISKTEIDLPLLELEQIALENDE